MGATAAILYSQILAKAEAPLQILMQARMVFA